MHREAVVNEILFYHALTRSEVCYLEKKTGYIVFPSLTTGEIDMAGSFKEEYYVECPYCLPYIVKEYLLFMQFDSDLLKESGIDMTIVCDRFYSHAYADKNDDLRTFVWQASQLRHDLGLKRGDHALDEGYRVFRMQLMKELAEDWLDEIQDQLNFDE